MVKLIMRRSVFAILLLLNISFAVAQKTDSLSAVKVVTKNVDGTIMSSAHDLVFNIALSPELTILSKAIKAAGLNDSLKIRQVTFFAPINKSMEKLAPCILDTLPPVQKASLIDLIKYHAIAGKITSKEIERKIKAGNGQASFTTLSGGIIVAKINENRNIVLTDERGMQSIVTRLDIEQANGMLFLVSEVLYPKSPR